MEVVVVSPTIEHKNNKVCIEVEFVHGGGQPQEYADHLYEYLVTISVPEGQAFWRKIGQTEDQVREFITPIIGTIPGWEINPWPSYTLEIFEQTSPGKWHIKYTYPFID